MTILTVFTTAAVPANRVEAARNETWSRLEEALIAHIAGARSKRLEQKKEAVRCSRRSRQALEFFA